VDRHVCVPLALVRLVEEVVGRLTCPIGVTKRQLPNIRELVCLRVCVADPGLLTAEGNKKSFVLAENMPEKRLGLAYSLVQCTYLSFELVAFADHSGGELFTCQLL